MAAVENDPVGCGLIERPNYKNEALLMTEIPKPVVHLAELL